MFGEHPYGGMTEIESRDFDFVENDFPSILNTSHLVVVINISIRLQKE